MRARTDDLSPDQRQILDDVEAQGLHIAVVAGDDGDDDGPPPHVASVGLWESFGQPEVVVFGLPTEVAAELLESIADEADEGHTFLDGTRHEGLLRDYPVRFVAVPKAHYAACFGAACWAYEGCDFPAVQLVWPDKQGRWPWDPAAREGFRAAQPVLGRADAGA
ncbi:MAG: DUF4262 domain-containing protein [Planctomycetes bacterium]|nr:DUF4262 domain-containing protein [Planctomycetota bacterium]